MNELANKDIEVLRITVKQGPVRASNVAEAVGWADNTDAGRGKIRYRWNKLEEKGLVESTYREEEAQGAQHAPRVVEATELGEEQYDEYEEEDYDADTLEERVERMETNYKQLQENYVATKQFCFDLDNRLETLEDALEGVDDVDDELDDLAEDIRNIRQALPDAPVIDADEMTFSDD
ncbi:hypothetical protein GRS48_12690 [Halorubrum sp. JWXQ-INN 858]|uniref:hypothetical protein n=1 Tax=Halorubrum sp. JWXQ-INN 858 TaxID=2690782 RepID=UPI0013567B08|nr:hypothetical protein [Halorubrum sp. JWXQ-INN 858]MWV65670.1 hypothetical protein [Halorubrum sp. JWXQ-INN 858]